jgi:nicotinate phosphoribosyltransferase
MTPKPPVSLWPDPDALGPLTDLYQLTMMAGYEASGMGKERATFEMFVRRLPSNRSYLVFAGMEQAVGDILRLGFSAEQVEAIRRLPAFAHATPTFFDGLLKLRFEGDVWAVPEGTVVFAGEPLMRIEATLPQAQWLETLLLASIGYPTLVASKAARIVEAAAGRPVYDFGLRRGHGPHAGLLAARASFLAGVAGTSNVEAAIQLGIPCSGTMAHSWVQSFETEAEAFETFARLYPNNSTLLVDTYDTASGVRAAAFIEPPIFAVRIDSGDLAEESIAARALLDSLNRSAVKIMASGDLNEYEIKRVLDDGARIDGFGVGTEMVTSKDAPALSIVYKLVAMNGQGRIKLSPGKKTYPLGKQIFRRSDTSGRFSHDLVTRSDENPGGEPLLVPVIRGGELVANLPEIRSIRDRARDQLASLPDGLRGLNPTGAYPLSYSDALEDAAIRLGVREK